MKPFARPSFSSVMDWTSSATRAAAELAGREVAGESTVFCRMKRFNALNKSNPSKAVPVLTTYSVASSCCTVADMQPSTGTLDLVHVTSFEGGSDSGRSLKCYRCSGIMDTAEPVSTTSSARQEDVFAVIVTVHKILWSN